MKIERLADLKRIEIGTKLRLTHCLMGAIPAAHQGRTVVAVKATAIGFAREGKDGVSWLSLPKARDFEPTANGFDIFTPDRVLAARYVFEVA